MCLIFLSLHHHPDYKLIIAANRDEFYKRSTAPAAFWNDRPQVLGGRDLEAGGTWMGVTTAGRLSLITNYRDISNIRADAPSRGQLVSDFLEGELDPQRYLAGVEQRGKAYNGFNLLAGSGDELWYLSNYRRGVEKLAPGYYGLSNHLLDTPWPKVVRGKEKLRPLLESEVIDHEGILDALLDEAIAPDHELPDTGVGLERERILSAMFIKSPGYGTRCSTVITIDRSNNVHFVEREYDVNTFTFSQRAFDFVMVSPDQQT